MLFRSPSRGLSTGISVKGQGRPVSRTAGIPPGSPTRAKEVGRKEEGNRERIARLKGYSDVLCTQGVRLLLLPMWRAEQLDSMRGSRRGLCACRHVKRSSVCGSRRLDSVRKCQYRRPRLGFRLKLAPAGNRVSPMAGQVLCALPGRVPQSPHRGRQHRVTSSKRRRDTWGGLLLVTFSSGITCEQVSH